MTISGVRSRQQVDPTMTLVSMPCWTFESIMGNFLVEYLDQNNVLLVVRSDNLSLVQRQHEDSV
jgi:hypothetical protein